VPSALRPLAINLKADGITDPCKGDQVAPDAARKIGDQPTLCPGSGEDAGVVGSNTLVSRLFERLAHEEHFICLTEFRPRPAPKFGLSEGPSGCFRGGHLADPSQVRRARPEVRD
jgi:hypothetical protein